MYLSVYLSLPFTLYISLFHSLPFSLSLSVFLSVSVCLCLKFFWGLPHSASPFRYFRIRLCDSLHQSSLWYRGSNPRPLSVFLFASLSVKLSIKCLRIEITLAKLASKCSFLITHPILVLHSLKLVGQWSMKDWESLKICPLTLAWYSYSKIVFQYRSQKFDSSISLYLIIWDFVKKKHVKICFYF
jgi:hypothetical protein